MNLRHHFQGISWPEQAIESICCTYNHLICDLELGLNHIHPPRIFRNAHFLMPTKFDLGQNHIEKVAI